jgi:hypothetical protein
VDTASALSAPRDNTTLVIYVDSYRVYVAMFASTYSSGVHSTTHSTIEPATQTVSVADQSSAHDVLALRYINATRHRLDVFADFDTVCASEAMQELQQILNELQGQATSLVFSIDSNALLSYQIPFTREFSAPQLKEFLAFELQHHAPDASLEEFRAALYPIQLLPSARSFAQSAVIAWFHPTLLDVVDYFAEILQISASRIDLAQMNAHLAQAFSYPEESRAFALICGVQGAMVDISVVKSGKLYGFSTQPLHESPSNPQELGMVCSAELVRLQREVGKPIEQVYFFGTDLTRQALNEASRVFPLPVKRLNPLRRVVAAELSVRQREYCARIAHILPPCVGSVLPEISAALRV